jgi:hypothetical protein
MPPHNRQGFPIVQQELDVLLNFKPDVSREDVLGFYGMWASPTELLVVLQNVGFPQPHLRADTFVVQVKGSAMMECGQFGWSGTGLYEATEQINPNCLLNADTNSFHGNSNFTGYAGHWGFALPSIMEVSTVVPADVQPNYLGTGTIITLQLKPPLAAAQLALWCQRPDSDIFDVTAIASSGRVVVDCHHLLEDGSLESGELSAAEFACQFEPSTLNTSELARCDNQTAARRRRASSPPAATQLTVDITALQNPSVDPADADAFLAALSTALGYSALAEVLAGVTGSNATAMLEEYLSEILPQLAFSHNVYLRGNPSETPVLSSVKASGKDAGLSAGDKLVLSFDRDTNMPATNPTERTVTKADLQRLFIFTPSLGNEAEDAFEGFWETRRQLVITINSPNLNNPALVESLDSLQIGFWPTSYNDSCREDPAPCGTDSSNGKWGLCNRLGSSCRMSAPFGGASIEGSWMTELPVKKSDNQLLYMLLLVVPLAILGYLAYRKNSEKRSLRRANKNWRSKFSNKKDTEKMFGEEELWSQPPAMQAMRAVADPFANVSENDQSAMAGFAPRAKPTLGASPFETADLGPQAQLPLENPLSSKTLNPIRSPVDLRSNALPALPRRGAGPGGLPFPQFGSPGAAVAGQPAPTRPSFANLAKTATITRRLSGLGEDPFGAARRNSKDRIDPFARPVRPSMALARPTAGSFKGRPLPTPSLPSHGPGDAPRKLPQPPTPFRAPANAVPMSAAARIASQPAVPKAFARPNMTRPAPTAIRGMSKVVLPNVPKPKPPGESNA